MRIGVIKIKQIVSNKYFIFLIPSPLILNLFYNLLNGNKLIENINLTDLISSIFIFSFFLMIGKCFNLINPNLNITFGIICYLFSFFLVELLILFFLQDMSINYSFGITNMLWAFYFLKNLNEKKYFFIIIFSYFTMFFFNNQFFESMTLNPNLLGDVYDVFYPNTEKIYNRSYFQSVSEPAMIGYPQFLSYLDAMIYKITFGSKSYNFFPSTTFLFFWLNILLFLELKIKKLNKIFLIVTFSTLILNSLWMQFLFTTSLMSERLTGYLFLGILVTFFQNYTNKMPNIKLILFVLSFIYLTKQFFSTLIIIFFVIFLLTKRLRKYSIYLLSSLFIKELSYITYFKYVPKDHHIRQIDVLDTIIDLLLFRDLELNNITIIFKNLLIDKPFSVIFFTYIIFFFCSAIFSDLKSIEKYTYFVIPIANLLLVLALYISVWKNMELQSPLRYIYAYLQFYLISIAYNFETFSRAFK